jgi:radical SAM superfamily enzyme YgiQ (UPF0313 family)
LPGPPPSQGLGPGTRTIFGGIHPTIAPESTIAEPAVDAICLGEGEDSVTEWLAALAAGAEAEASAVAGLWVKSRDGSVRRNPMRPLIEDLDRLPSPARDLLDPARLQAELYGTNLLSSRGCPFPCTYCQNDSS